MIRGSFGIFYDNVFTNVADNIQASAPNASAPTVNGAITGRGTGAWFSSFAALNPNPTNSVTSTIPNLRNPIVYHTSRGERELPVSRTCRVLIRAQRASLWLDFPQPALFRVALSLYSKGQIRLAARSPCTTTPATEHNSGTLQWWIRRYRSVFKLASPTPTPNRWMTSPRNIPLETTRGIP